MTVLFPSSYLNKKLVDEDFQKEYEAALKEGFNIALFHQELWDKKREIKIFNLSKKEDPVFPFIDKDGLLLNKTIYRGWMMKPDEYSSFYHSLCNNGLLLINSPDQYNHLHIFKNSYESVKEDAPKTVFFSSINEINLEELNKSFKRFMIKDFVKSVKGTDFPPFFEQPSKEEFDYWMEKFIIYRGSLFTGGIQIKEYLDLKMYDNLPNEYRVFYGGGNILSICANSNQPSFAKKINMDLVYKYRNLNSQFYTIDFIECKDGTFKVIETGDGGVSGLSYQQEESSFYRAIQFAIFKEYDRFVDNPFDLEDFDYE